MSSLCLCAFQVLHLKIQLRVGWGGHIRHCRNPSGRSNKGDPGFWGSARTESWATGRVEKRPTCRPRPEATEKPRAWGWPMTRTRHRGGRQAGSEARGRAKSSGTRRKTEAGVKVMSVSGERGGGLCIKMREERCEEHWRRGGGRLEVRWLMSTSTGRRPHSQNLSLLFMTSTKEPRQLKNRIKWNKTKPSLTKILSRGFMKVRSSSN